jgi:hypothetical protein
LDDLDVEHQWVFVWFGHGASVGHKTIVADFIAKQQNMKNKMFNYSSILLATY